VEVTWGEVPMANREIVRLKPRFGHALEIWWTYVWRATLWTALTTLPFSVAVPLLFRGHRDAPYLILLVIGNVIFILMSGLAMRVAVSKQFKEFEVWLVKREGP